MPKTIPPPPPQPSVEETKQAIRFTWGTMLAFFLVFLGISQCYHRDSTMVEYGRKSTHSWNVWRAHNLDMPARRSHSEGKIAWLIGSSIMRESFDEADINKKLAAQESPYRVIKLSVDRGAAGIIFGMLRHADIKSGDIVLHNIAVGNYKKDWLEYIDLPAHQMMELYEAQDFWDLQEWGIADKLEQSSAIPYQFYAHHENHMNGLEKWWISLWQGKSPKKKKPGYQTTFLNYDQKPGPKPSPKHYAYIGKDGLDLSSSHINSIGLHKMRTLCQEQGAELFLIDIPPRQQYMAELVHQNAQAEWKQWRQEQTRIQYFAQQPEDHYYDLTHPNFRGRSHLSNQLVMWLLTPEKGIPAVVTWPIPDYNK